MKIESPEQLEKLIKILRKNGVESGKFGDVELKLRSEEPQSKYKRKQSKTDSKEVAPEIFSGVDWTNMTPEQKAAHEERLLFWSSPGIADNG